MSDPKKKKKLKKQVRQIEDEFGVDSTTEDLVDGIIDLFSSDDDDDEGESDDSSDDSSDDDFGGGDFGGGGSDDDW